MKTDIHTENDLEIIITDIIQQLGIPANIKGYQYLRYALILCAENGEMAASITKLLYPAIAKKYDTTVICVSSAISRAIEVLWDKRNEEVLCLYFGSTILKRQGKPTNGEFIATVSDRLRLNLKAKKKK